MTDIPRLTHVTEIEYFYLNDFDNHSISAIIRELERIKEKLGDVDLDVSYGYGDSSDTYRFRKVREETDDEYAERVAKLKATAKKMKEDKEKRDRSEYERLKKKFGDGNG